METVAGFIMVWLEVVGYGIPCAYGVIFLGAVTGLIYGSRLVTRFLLSSYGWIFSPCGYHYFSFARNHDLATLSVQDQLTLSAVFVVGALTALLVNPVTVAIAARYLNKQIASIERQDWIIKNTSACIVFLQYVNINESIVLGMSHSMMDWFATHNICPIELVVEGANWWDLLGYKRELPPKWKIQNQDCAENMINFVQRVEHWEDKNVWFYWTMSLINIKERTYTIEWFDATKDRDRIMHLEQENTTLAAANKALSAEKMISIKEKLDAINVKEVDDNATE